MTTLEIPTLRAPEGPTLPPDGSDSGGGSGEEGRHENTTIERGLGERLSRFVVRTLFCAFPLEAPEYMTNHPNMIRKRDNPQV